MPHGQEAPDDVAGVGPWQTESSNWPTGSHLDSELLHEGDRRNVEDQYRYWNMDAIRADLVRRSTGLEIAIENLEHDFNIGSIVRTANALGAQRVWIVGKRRWNRRGAMVTDRYLDVQHIEDVDEFAQQCQQMGKDIIGIDIVSGSQPLEEAELSRRTCLVFGAEATGLSPQMRAHCSQILHITQHGSTRSMNVGHAAAIAMWAWVTSAR